MTSPLTHALALGLALAETIARGLRPLLVHSIALALALLGYRPAPRVWVPAPQVAAIRPALLASLPVPQLRTVARRRLGSAARPGGRRIAQATRAALLEVLA